MDSFTPLDLGGSLLDVAPCNGLDIELSTTSNSAENYSDSSLDDINFLADAERVGAGGAYAWCVIS
jgi:hypothetical protein